MLRPSLVMEGLGARAVVDRRRLVLQTRQLALEVGDEQIGEVAWVKRATDRFSPNPTRAGCLSDTLPTFPRQETSISLASAPARADDET